jgi:hypothetical protein
MAVSESQLEVWSHQGAVITATTTHELIRNALSSDSSHIQTSNFEVFLQGSYKNSTNIRGESDVDIVVQLNDTYHRDLSALPPDQESAYMQARSEATYLLPQFRADVLQTLRDRFGSSSIIEGNKSLKLPRDSGRLPADVVVCLQYRKYRRFTSQSQSYTEGIAFDTQNGRRIISFPKSHYENGTTKNDRTNGFFKKSVRMFKNAREFLVQRGTITSQLAPSYFVECLLYNVPDENFGPTFRDTYYKVINCLNNSNSSDLAAVKCQDGQLQLFGNEPEQWSVHDAQEFSTALARLWNES